MKNIYKWLIDYGLKSHSKFPFNVQIKESLRNLLYFVVKLIIFITWNSRFIVVIESGRENICTSTKTL